VVERQRGGVGRQYQGDGYGIRGKRRANDHFLNTEAQLPYAASEWYTPPTRPRSCGDRPGIGAPGHLFKSARVATYYNVLHYITMSFHKGYCWPEQLATWGYNVSRTVRKALDNNPGKGLTWEVTNGAITESALPSWKQIGATAHP
jgi:hypothetical protein